MDPIQALQNIRSLIADIEVFSEECEEEEYTDTETLWSLTEDLVHAVGELDVCLSKGGFSPWEQGR
jgi:hypothetical protein